MYQELWERKVSSFDDVVMPEKLTDGPVFISSFIHCLFSVRVFYIWLNYNIYLQVDGVNSNLLLMQESPF